jgi:transposase
VLKIEQPERQIQDWHRQDEVSQRLGTVPSIGPIWASAMAAIVPDASIFGSGRQFAAWLGLVPRHHGSSSKDRLGGTTGYLRRLLLVGFAAVMRIARKEHANQLWLISLLATKPTKIACVG